MHMHIHTRARTHTHTHTHTYTHIRIYTHTHTRVHTHTHTCIHTHLLPTETRLAGACPRGGGGGHLFEECERQQHEESCRVLHTFNVGREVADCYTFSLWEGARPTYEHLHDEEGEGVVEPARHVNHNSHTYTHSLTCNTRTPPC